MNNETKDYTFLWLIENYSYCWHQNGERLISPEFTADGFQGTAWCLQLYPRGQTDEYKGSISIFLHRSKVDYGPVEFPLKFEISVLAADGSSLCSKEFQHIFRMGKGYGNAAFLDMNEVLLQRNTEYLPRDNFSVQCKVWKGEGNKQPATQISARTRIGIEHLYFLHVIEGFSTIKPHEKKTISIRSPSKKRLTLSSSLYFSDDSCCDGKIRVEVALSGTNQILAKCKLSLLEASGKKYECCKTDNRFDATRKNIRKMTLCLTKQAILNRKGEYLPDDKLTLSFECSFSSGVEYEKIESTQYEKPFVTLNQISNSDKNKVIYAEKLSDCPSALDDLKSSYNYQFFTDVELKTKTKSFPAHKIVLCSRSPVFKATMTNDMKEKNSNFIQVDDLEDDVVEQLLLFMYTDDLENLEWESAIKLYYAGDKYAIERLKLLCSSFLVQNLTTSAASELLLLADTHNDSFLKKVVEDFIFENSEDVFRSDEWENLAEENPRLVSKIMLMRYK
ncbi:Speckle-type POZ protein [Araneus ventricosus]|uniref:Speckle-type POZ protein n=1 Tax=Araneus ventricosus TaxID=182803 RepID=A0A4Y2W6S7_ARAVE|nr:Speckle-type POZ protein [Araneus ventricosus]